MTEHQRYDVVRTEPEFELRRYPQHMVAEVEVDGTFESAGTTAFRPLVGYIGGLQRHQRRPRHDRAGDPAS